jgi:hypothetical protein
MAITDNDEKRKYSRVGFTTQIQIMFEADGNIVNLDGKSSDLSLKGLFVSTEEKFSMGTTCSIKVYLSSGIEKIEMLMKGTVVRADKAGLGIVFDSMDMDTYSHLKNIVYYNSIDASDE